MNNHIYHRYRARKRFGQHFLRNRSVIDAIITAINPKSNQSIIEIGPGFGALTKPMIEHVNSMTVIELDHDLAVYLARHHSLQTKLNIIIQDAMKVNFTTLFTEQGQPLRIFGNLPYNIAIPLILHLLNYTHAIHDMHFMLQKEVVERLVAVPNNKKYGRLSVIIQYYCRILPILEVSPTSFWPPPKVNSVMVKLVPHIRLPFPVQDLSKLNILTKLAFNQRRKKISNSLSALFNMQQLAELGIDATQRAENVSVEHYCHLANMLVERPIS